MTMTISQKAYWELVCEAQCDESLCPSDAFDMIWRYPAQLGSGTYRELQLRQGVNLGIAHYHLHDDVLMQLPERSHPLEYTFAIAGNHKYKSFTPIAAGHYLLFGSGMAPIERYEKSAAEPILQVNVHIDPGVFQTFLGDSVDLASVGLEHLVRPTDQRYYQCLGKTTVAMQTVLHQILHCPFQSITKKLHLESKVWELMALLIEQEQERHQGKGCSPRLKPDDVDRIHQARDILLRQLDQPPSLLDLARQVGLNDCTLKRGFRQVFGTTAFGCLHDHRLEQARRLLQERRLNVSEVANTVGFANRSYFAAAFRKKFGVSPREYLTQPKNSV